MFSVVLAIQGGPYDFGPASTYRVRLGHGKGVPLIGGIMNIDAPRGGVAPKHTHQYARFALFSKCHALTQRGIFFCQTKGSMTCYLSMTQGGHSFSAWE